MNRSYRSRAVSLPALLMAALSFFPAVNARAGGHFSLSIDTVLLQPRSPAEEARLAKWNSPMGRVAYAVAREQAGLGAGGLVGHSMGVAMRVGFRPHLRPELISAAVEQGVATSERDLGRIHWPWEKQAPGENPMTLEEQLSRLLGRRLELKNLR